MSETVLGNPTGAPATLAASEHVALIGASPVTVPNPMPILIGTPSLEAIGMEIGTLQTTDGSANWPVVNLAYFIPFGVAVSILVRKLWVYNGAAVAGNVDMGIYKPDGTLIVSKGSTAQVNVNQTQDLDITDTWLVPGRYYLAITADTDSTTQRVVAHSFAASGLASACGVLQQASAFPLATNANPATFATCTQTLVPTCGLNTRTLLQ